MEGTTFEKDNFFKIDVEAHIMGNTKYISYFPDVQRAERVGGRILHWLGLRKLEEEEYPGELSEEELLLWCMERYGVDMACVLPESLMVTTGYSARWLTNGELAAICQRHPDRFILQPNFGPIIKRGVKHVIWELEYFVKEHNCKIVKFYPPEDTYINDRNLWPFYQKISELGVVLSVHAAANFFTPQGFSKYAHPTLLEEVAAEFPEMTIIAFHFGWPWCSELNVAALVYRNIYIGTSMFTPWAISAPRRFAHLIGEALTVVQSERIIWGSDYAKWPPMLRYAVEGLREFQMPEDMPRGYGYPSLSVEDKAQIFGLNLARLLNIKPVKRV